MNRYLKVLLVAAILLCMVGAASSQTEPTKESITNFITNFEAPAGEDYLESFYNAYTSEIKDRQSRHTPKEIGPDIDAREICTDAVKKVKEKSSSRIAVPKGIDACDTYHRVNKTIDAVVENFEQSEDKSPGFLRQLLEKFLLR